MKLVQGPWQAFAAWTNVCEVGAYPSEVLGSLLDSHVHIRLGCKGFPEKNTLTY